MEGGLLERMDSRRFGVVEWGIWSSKGSVGAREGGLMWKKKKESGGFRLSVLQRALFELGA